MSLKLDLLLSFFVVMRYMTFMIKPKLTKTILKMCATFPGQLSLSPWARIFIWEHIFNGIT